MLKINISVLFILVVFLIGCSEQLDTAPVPIQDKTPTAEIIIDDVSDLSLSEEVNYEVVEPDPIDILTHDGVSIKIYWVYADNFRIALAYEVADVEVPDGYTLYCPVQSMTLVGSPGNLQYSYVDGNFNLEDMITNCELQADGSFFVTHNFYLPNLENNTEFDLSVDILIGGMPVFSDQLGITHVPTYEIFHFQQAVAKGDNLTIKKLETALNNGVEITMDRIEFNPSFINAYMCIDYENNKEWYPEVLLNIRENEIKADPYLVFRTDIQDIDFSDWNNQFTSHRCFRFGFPTDRFEFLSSLPDQTTVMVEKITIDSLKAVTENDCIEAREKAQQTYPELDFSCRFGNRDESYHEISVDIAQKPEGMSPTDAQQIARESFFDVISGPWNFSIPLP